MSRSATSALLMLLGVLFASCSDDGDAAETFRTSLPTLPAIDATYDRDPAVPDLPFDDNPDPDQCGIPTRWGLDEPAWLTGMWEGELIQPDVHLYDSHLRLAVSGIAEHGSEVRIELFQENPVLDYYLVTTVDGSAEGWVPAPFLSFEPVAPA